MENFGSNQSLVRISNQKLIVDYVRKNKQLSRSELAKSLRLSNPSISKNIDDLIGRGLIVEGESVKTQIGRRPKMLRFNGKCACVAAIDLSGAKIKICVSDLEGGIINSNEIDSGEFIDEKIIFGVCDELERILKETEGIRGTLRAICIGSPGNIDPETGRIRYALRIKDYENLDLGGIFTQRFNVKALVKNDVNLAVSGEHVFGIGIGIQNLLYVSVDRGVGAGIILNQNLYEGSRGFAGEIGMIDIGNGDRLDEVCSIDRIVSNISKTSTHRKKLTYSEVIRRLKSGDGDCIREVVKSSETLAAVLKNTSELLDLEMIIIGGEAMKFGDIYIEPIRKALGEEVKVNWSMLAETATISGAIGEATKQAITQIINMQSA